MTTRDEIAEYYERHRLEAERLAQVLAEARQRGASPAYIRALEQALERASYVGD